MAIRYFLGFASIVATISTTLASCATAFAEATERIYAVVASFLVYAIKAVAEPFQFPRIATSGGGAVGIWHGNASPRVERHEANMSRRAADRHT